MRTARQPARGGEAASPEATFIFARPTRSTGPTEHVRSWRRRRVEIEAAHLQRWDRHHDVDRSEPIRCSARPRSRLTSSCRSTRATSACRRLLSRGMLDRARHAGTAPRLPELPDALRGDRPRYTVSIRRKEVPTPHCPTWSPRSRRSTRSSAGCRLQPGRRARQHCSVTRHRDAERITGRRSTALRSASA